LRSHQGTSGGSGQTERTKRAKTSEAYAWYGNGALGEKREPIGLSFRPASVRIQTKHTAGKESGKMEQSTGSIGSPISPRRSLNKIVEAPVAVGLKVRCPDLATASGNDPEGRTAFLINQVGRRLLAEGVTMKRHSFVAQVHARRQMVQWTGTAAETCGRQSVRPFHFGQARRKVTKWAVVFWFHKQRPSVISHRSHACLCPTPINNPPHRRLSHEGLLGPHEEWIKGKEGEEI